MLHIIVVFDGAERDYPVEFTLQKAGVQEAIDAVKLLYPDWVKISVHIQRIPKG